MAQFENLTPISYVNGFGLYVKNIALNTSNTLIYVVKISGELIIDVAMSPIRIFSTEKQLNCADNSKPNDMIASDIVVDAFYSEGEGSVENLDTIIDTL